MSTKYSTIFASKLPAFIADDPAYSRFIQFFEAYYNWFDDTYDIYGLGEKLDIDSGFEQFYPYFAQDFLPYFPDIDTIATDKVKLIKIAKELYKAKGIPDSFKFLFRALFNVHAEVYPTSQFILRPSYGRWLVPKSIKIKSIDSNFLHINNFKIFGETSKSIAIIEQSKVNGKFIQIYISNIQRLFMSGETITILDYDNNPVYFFNGEYFPHTDKYPAGSVKLTSKIIGSLSNIDIVPTRRGKYYAVGDPVVITGGLNTQIANPIGAKATISEITTGQIQNILITNGGYGYRVAPNSSISVTNDVSGKADCQVSVVNGSLGSNVAYISDDCIENQLFVNIGAANYNFSSTANANTQLSNFFNLIEYPVYPIIAITVLNGGGGFTSEPILNVQSTFPANTNIQTYNQNLKDLGILAPIKIINPGTGYTINDTITISGGDGNFAFAKINSVNASLGSITSVGYYYNANTSYALGGMGYTNDNLPIATVNSSTGANAVLTIPAILGTGVKYTVETDKIGAITKITLTENGEDYINVPNVSLRIQDIVVSGLESASDVNLTTSIVYQGDYALPTFSGNINSINSIYYNPVTSEKLFSIEVYDYIGTISANNSTLFVRNTETNEFIELVIQQNYSDAKFTNGIKIYGDGSAKASAKFLNGLIEDSGRYLNNDGQLSSYSIVQSDVYNLSTYVIATEKSYDSYKTVLENLIHPIGNRLVTKNLIKSNASYRLAQNSTVQMKYLLANVNSLLIQNVDSYYTNTVEIITDLDIDTIFTVNTHIYISGPTNLNVYSTIANINIDSNLLTLTDFVQYKFPNVYSGFTQGNTIILTNGNNYNIDKYSVNTFIHVGDAISTPNNSPQEIINISNNIIYFTNQLNLNGNTLNPTNITVIKELLSNTITTYTTV
jgi:hypothetical protein